MASLLAEHRGRLPRAGAGCGGDYAASVLRDMYGGSLPRAASQLLADHAKARSVSLPPPGRRREFTTGLAEIQDKKRTVVRVPRVGQKKTQESQAAPSRPPKLPVRKSHMLILAETSNYERVDDHIAPSGPDCAEQKWHLQNKNAFGFGSALPTTGAPVRRSPHSSASLSPTSKRTVRFASALPSRGATPPRAGPANEQERLVADIAGSVRERQRELEDVEKTLVELTERAEAPAERQERRRVVRCGMVEASKRRLELKNAIRKDVEDLERLLDLSPDGDG